MKKLLPFTLLAFIIILAGCKKDDDTNEPPPVVPGPIELKENVKVVDHTLLSLDTTETDISTGIYVLTYTGTESNPVVTGDIIVGEEGEGYIRRVISVSQSGNIITLTTEQANMEDVFKSGTFNFSTNFDGMIPGKTSGFTHSVSNQELYNQDGLKIEMVSGIITMDPEWYFDFGFGLEGINKFEMSTTGSSFSADASVKVTASQSVTLVDESYNLVSKTKRMVYLVPVGPIAIPIVIVVNFKLIADYSATVNAAATSTANLSTTSTLDLGVRYTSGQWTGIYNVSPVTTLDITQPIGNVGITFDCAVRPNITVKINGVFGPYANILAPTSSVTGTVALPSLDWDLKAEAWLKTSLGADVSILGYTLATYGPVEWETEKLTYHRPDKIERTSGDNQTADPNEALPQPIKVRILDSRELPVSGVPVYFNVTAGGGSMNPQSVLTNSSGYAEADWTLGVQQTAVQYATASAKYGNGSLLNSAPIEFAAVTTGLPIVSTSSASSITETSVSSGGNVINDGGTNVTARGICWNTAVNPTLTDNVTTNGSGTGSFATNLTGLISGETYYVRAYATNSVGTAYGNEVNFTTIEIDSTEIYKALCVGSWTVTGYDPVNPPSTNYLELFADGTGMYGGTYPMSWSIQHSVAGYKFYESGYWHPGYDYLVRDRLSYPVNTFNLYADFDPNFVNVTYVKN
jgi:hypothetical protein